ncbi:MAG TPA: M12 family metallopeptidase [Chthoniobacterales bacterium]
MQLALRGTRRAWRSVSFCALVLLVRQSPAAAFEDDLAVYDRLIAEVPPDESLVRFGDVGITPAQLRDFRQRLVRLKDGEPLPDVVTPAGSSFKWPAGNVYYRFDPTEIGNGTINVAKMQQFRDAVAEWAAFANLHFIENISGQANFITVKETPGLGGGFSSSVGMHGGEQTIEFDPQAWNRGTICHEVGHALGLWHEQQRPDRDTYVVINFGNIPANQQGNFAVVPSGQVFGTAYDFYSVMHYRRDQYAINPNIDTISMQPGNAQYIDIIGQVYDRTLSKIERAGMATIYGAPSVIPGATVTNTNDSGPGTLRTALYYGFDRETDSPPAPTAITFHIPTSDAGYSSGVFTIRPTFGLVAPGPGTIIDGATQTAFTGNTNPSGPEIMLDGSRIGAANLNIYAAGLALRETNCRIRNLVISGFNTQGIVFDGFLAARNNTSASNNVVSGCYIGTDATGTTAIRNGPSGWPGIELTGGAFNNTIGGLTSNDRNVISGNTGYGVSVAAINSNNNLVAGNFIGTNAAATGALGNGYGGVLINNGAANNTIGGLTTGARNIISGNQNEGVRIEGSGTSGNSVVGNYIGTNPAGTAALGNGQSSHWPGLIVEDGAQSTTIRANVISGNTGNGVFLSDSGTAGNIVEGNFIGTDPTGSSAVPNQWSGVALFGACHDNTIGGLTSGARNIISGNGNEGISIGDPDTSNNNVVGNYIGVNAAGTAALPNQYAGISIYGTAVANRIGGLTSSARNVISGNANQGITISDSDTSGNIVEGNFIGLDASGLVALPNQYSGIDLFLGASGNTIGGTSGGARNYVSGNNVGGSGMSISGSGTNNNLVQGNTIGLNIAGAVVPNAYQGIAIFGGASNNAIGGTVNGASNVIAGNTFEGVAVFDLASVANAIEQNSIFGNNFRGIGIYSNANNSAAAPTVSSASVSTAANPNGTDLSGGLTRAANTNFRIEFFASPAGSDEGKTFIGVTNVLTSGGGLAPFGPVHLAAAMPDGTVITATATDASGNTSQFSAPVSATTTDSDGDAIPDSWMLAHFGHAIGQVGDQSRANDDADGDGLTNLQEFLAGTDPQSAASKLRVISLSETAHDIALTFASVVGKTYRVDARDDWSAAWQLFEDGVVASGASTQIVDAGGRSALRRFYRVSIEP